MPTQDPTATDRSGLAIILAAGKGTRMKSDLPKVLHPVAGLPMVAHAIEAARAAGLCRQAIVVGHRGELVRDRLAERYEGITFHTQETQNGTADAVLAARDAIAEGYDDIVVLYGDVPLITADTLTASRKLLAGGASVVVLGFETANPQGYGRLLVEDGNLLAIREEKDATDEERAVTLCNSGVILMRGDAALNLLEQVTADNAQGELYLTDVVEIGRREGLNVVATTVPAEETLGVNDRVQLAEVEAIWQDRRRAELARTGVSMSAPHTVFLHHDTRLEADVTVEPNVVFGPKVSVAKGATIRAFSHLEGATVGENSVVGPYARLRPGTELGADTKVGNFVETKAANVAEGAKINHLSYVGDATVGADANVGAGTITCNYDGANKHRTTIGAGAFIGSNTALVAPVSIGDGATTGAGSTIVDDVPSDALALARGRQVNLSGKARELRERNLAIKAAK